MLLAVPYFFSLFSLSLFLFVGSTTEQLQNVSSHQGYVSTDGILFFPRVTIDVRLTGSLQQVFERFGDKCVRLGGFFTIKLCLSGLQGSLRRKKKRRREITNEEYRRLHHEKNVWTKIIIKPLSHVSEIHTAQCLSRYEVFILHHLSLELKNLCDKWQVVYMFS